MPGLGLHDDIWSAVLIKLDFRSKLACERVSRQLRGLLRHPALWPSFDLTFEQLVGNDNELLLKDIETPAGRCAYTNLPASLDSSNKLSVGPLQCGL